MIIWPKELISNIARRRFVLVVGSGVSRNSQNDDGRRPKSWEEFLRDAAKSLQSRDIVEEFISRRDFLTACELVKNEIEKSDREEFINLVHQEYQKPGYTHADIHKYLYELDSPIVISPNFDVIYDTYARSTSKGSVVVKEHTSPDLIKFINGGDHRLIVKSHGSANSPSDIIFTRSDYAKARTKHALFYEIVRALVLTHTFLFVGCGIDDPDIRVIFEDVQYENQRMPYHYMTLPHGEVPTAIQLLVGNAMKLKFLEYDISDGHRDLTESLKSLCAEVEQNRESLTQSRKW